MSLSALPPWFLAIPPPPRPTDHTPFLLIPSCWRRIICRRIVSSLLEPRCCSLSADLGELRSIEKQL